MKTLKILLILLSFFTLTYSQINDIDNIVDRNRSFTLQIDVSTFDTDTAFSQIGDRLLLGGCKDMTIQVEYFGLDDTTATISVSESNIKWLFGGYISSDMPYVMNRNDSVIIDTPEGAIIGYSASKTWSINRRLLQYLNINIIKNSVTSGTIVISIIAYKETSKE